MRVSKEQAAENRRLILNAAAELIRERGISGVGVDALTEAAGLTHGSVYSQFGSKDRLVSEALRVAIEQNALATEDARTLSSFVTNYLSADHRDRHGTGCTVAALGCEMARASHDVRGGFTAGVRRMIERVGGLIAKGTKRRRDDEAIAAVATLVGALILARAVDDRELADQILDASRKAVIRPARA